MTDLDREHFRQLRLDAQEFRRAVFDADHGKREHLIRTWSPCVENAVRRLLSFEGYDKNEALVGRLVTLAWEVCLLTEGFVLRLETSPGTIEEAKEAATHTHFKIATRLRDCFSTLVKQLGPDQRDER